MTNVYDEGDLVRLTAKFTILTELTNPSAVTLQVIGPDRATGTYAYPATITRPAGTTGIYYRDVSLDLVGRYDYNFQGTGTVQAVGAGKFLVRRTDF